MEGIMRKFILITISVLFLFITSFSFIVDYSSGTNNNSERAQTYSEDKQTLLFNIVDNFCDSFETPLPLFKIGNNLNPQKISIINDTLNDEFYNFKNLLLYSFANDLETLPLKPLFFESTFLFIDSGEIIKNGYVDNTSSADFDLMNNASKKNYDFIYEVLNDTGISSSFKYASYISYYDETTDVQKTFMVYYDDNNNGGTLFLENTLYLDLGEVKNIPEMVLVKKGSFKLGNNTKVQLTYDYFIGKYEVTFEEYDEFCYATGKEVDYELGELVKHPVVYVSWWDAIEYCNWLSKKQNLPLAYDEDGQLIDENGKITSDISKVVGYRLPTEAEWEYAAKGGHKSTSDYKYAGSNRIKDVGWYIGNSNDVLHEVGGKSPNSLGLFDMTGNVWEWTEDWNNGDFYEKPPKTNPANLEDPDFLSSPMTGHTIRGGCWNCDIEYCDLLYRYSYTPWSTFNNVGFRIARTK